MLCKASVALKKTAPPSSVLTCLPGLLRLYTFTAPASGRRATGRYLVLFGPLLPLVTGNILSLHLVEGGKLKTHGYSVHLERGSTRLRSNKAQLTVAPSLSVLPYSYIFSLITRQPETSPLQMRQKPPNYFLLLAHMTI